MRSSTVAWIAGLLWIWGGISLLRADVYSDTLQFTEEFGDGKSFYLGTASGSVTIEGDEGNVVRIVAVKKAEGSENKARKALEALKVKVKRTGDRLEVTTEFPGEDGLLSRIFGDGGNERNVWVDYQVKIPSRLEVTVDATSAGVDIRNVGGKVSLDLTSGNVVGQALGGDVSVDGTSGNVELRQVGGDLLIDNTSGDLLLEECGRGIRVDKTSGQVSLRKIAGDVEIDGTSCDVIGEGIGGYVSLDLVSGNAELRGLARGISFDDVSGDLRASFASAPSRESQLSSISGDVRLFLPEEVDLDLDLESVSGRLLVELEGLEVREVSKSALRAVTGNGRVPVSVDTVSGDIEVRNKGL